jgi:magnesium chelatase subunit D
MQVAMLLAVQGRALGGVHLRCQSSAMTRRWIALIEQLHGEMSVRVPVNCSHDQLVGGVDVAASLLGDGPVSRPGLLTRAHNAPLILPYAALHSAVTLRTICHALDTGVLPTSTGVSSAGGALQDNNAPGNNAQSNNAQSNNAQSNNAQGNSARPGAAEFFVAALDPTSVTTTRSADRQAAAMSPQADTVDANNDDGDEHNQIDASLLDRLAFSIAVDDAADADTSGTLSALLDAPVATGAADETDSNIAWFAGKAGAVDLQSLRHCIRQAQKRLPAITPADDQIEGICALASVCGIESVRAQLYCLRVAQTSAALAGRDSVSDQDIELAVSLCFAWRATELPSVSASDQHDQTQEPSPQEQSSQEQSPQEQAETSSESEPENSSDESAAELAATEDQSPHNQSPTPDVEADKEASGEQIDSNDSASDNTGQTNDQRIETAVAALPKDLLDALASSFAERHIQVGKAGRSGGAIHSAARGRAVGSQRYRFGSDQKIDVLATLREAAPWQAIRRQQSRGSRLLIVHPQDVRAVRYRQSAQAVTIFAVDASGSSAAQRLAEARGAVELLLAECYVRRDQVALIVFQGARAQLVLPPTRSLVRARRELAQLPVGGGTPLPSAIDLATQLGSDLFRGGFTPLLCLLTDGRANVDRDGVGGRERALQQSLQSARRYQQTGLQSLIIDTSVRASAFTDRLAVAMGGAHLKLPRADAKHISKAINTVAQHARSGAA